MKLPRPKKRKLVKINKNLVKKFKESLKEEEEYLRTGKLPELSERQCKQCGEFKLSTEYYGSNKKRLICKICCQYNQRFRYKYDNKFRELRKTRQYEYRARHKETYNAFHRKWASESVIGIYQRVKRNSRKKSFKQVIDKANFIDWYMSQKKECFYCGIRQEDKLKNPIFFKQAHLTIDRKDSSKSYVNGNLAISCSLCNTVKTNFFSAEEMKNIAKKFIRSKIKR